MPGPKLLVATGLSCALAIAGSGTFTIAADHGDSPAVRLDARLDLNDTYIFQSPQTPANTVMIMTVSPLAGITGPTTFHPSADYDFMIDTDGDALTDLRFRVAFGAPGQGNVQPMHLQVETGSGVEVFTATGFTGQNNPLPNGGQMRANLADDPFFFDLLAFRNSLSFCPNNVGTNFFRGLNTLAIVVEVPSSMFPTNKIGMWARTTTGDRGQVDREGRPAINTVFIPAAFKDAFNFALPVADQAQFRGHVVNTLLSLGNSQATANALADVLLPDIMTFDTTSRAGFLNGRRLEDDVIDAELNLITGGAVKGDCVANDSAFTTTFPYWARPNP